jgi:predicted O-methyltransferase YrrM
VGHGAPASQSRDSNTKVVGPPSFHAPEAVSDLVAEITVTSQVNAPDDLNLDLGWRIGERNFEDMVQAIAQARPQVIVEFGAGASSIRLSRAFRESRVFSIEHDAEYFREVKQLQHQHGATNLCIQRQRLMWQIHGLRIFQSYQRVKLPKVIDAVIIDGPPHYTFMGREACLYQVYRQLRVGGIVILDDSDRAAEAKYIESWLLRYPGSFRRLHQSENRRLGILLKERHVRGRIVGWHLVQNYSRLINRIYNGPFVVRIRKLYVSAKEHFRSMK